MSRQYNPYESGTINSENLLELIRENELRKNLCICVCTFSLITSLISFNCFLQNQSIQNTIVGIIFGLSTIGLIVLTIKMHYFARTVNGQFINSKNENNLAVMVHELSILNKSTLIRYYISYATSITGITVIILGLRLILNYQTKNEKIMGIITIIHSLAIFSIGSISFISAKNMKKKSREMQKKL